MYNCSQLPGPVGKLLTKSNILEGETAIKEHPVCAEESLERGG